MFSHDRSEMLWFILSREGITLPSREAGTRLMSIEVDDPVAVAERCWDAGYAICAVDPGGGDTMLSVIDPFGRQIELARPEDHQRDSLNHRHLEVHT